MDQNTVAIHAAAEELGYQSLKPEQLKVMQAFVSGRDVFAVLPTGFGKSLCYACLPCTFDKLLMKERGHSIVIVVTPLLSIMKYQVRDIRAHDTDFLPTCISYGFWSKMNS